MSVDAWYSQASLVNFEEPELLAETMTFTQMIWLNMTRVGFGFGSVQDAGIFFIVCNYFPPGNVEMDIDENVFPARDEII